MEPAELNRIFVTPVLQFDDDGAIDEKAYRGFLQRFLVPEYVEAGIGIIANPEAGELFCLDRDERRQAIQIVLDEVEGRVPVLAGVQHVTTAGSVETAEDAAELGVDGLFMFPPVGAGDITMAWNADLYPEILIDLLKAVDAAVNLPMVVHAVGPMTPLWGPGLPAGITRKVLEEVPNVVGWKMTYSYNGYRAITRVIRSVGRPVALLAANSAFFHENLASHAFDGTSSGGFNYGLEPMMEHIAAWKRGDVARAQEIWDGGLAALHEYVFSDFARLHIRYKIAAWLRGFIPNPLMRAPMPRPLAGEIEELYARLAAAGLSTIERAQVDDFISSRLSDLAPASA